MNTIFEALAGFGINFLIAFTIVRFIYYPLKPNRNYVFTFLAFNTVIYFLLGLLTSVDLGIGVGFGLFAIFSVLRYRTDPMPTREMTYLFVIIALPVMNSILLGEGRWNELLVANGGVMAVLYLLEREWGFYFEASKRVVYERIDLIKPEKHDLLLADLQERTGLPITRIDVGRIDFVRKTVQIKVHYPNGHDDSEDLEYLDEPELAIA